jgi:hypothetical protein
MVRNTRHLQQVHILQRIRGHSLPVIRGQLLVGNIRHLQQILILLRINWLAWIRIQIRIENADPDLDQGARKLTKNLFSNLS